MIDDRYEMTSIFEFTPDDENAYMRAPRWLAEATTLSGAVA
jgi:hypothetical protein